MSLKEHQKPSYNLLHLKHERIKVMKNLLQLDEEADDITEEELCEKLEKIARHNLLKLININLYVSELPTKINEFIQQISSYVNDEQRFQNFISEYKLQYKVNPVFREFKEFVFVHLSKDLIMDLEADESTDMQIILNKAVGNKFIYLILLFLILSVPSQGVTQNSQPQPSIKTNEAMY